MARVPAVLSLALLGCAATVPPPPPSPPPPPPPPVVVAPPPPRPRCVVAPEPAGSLPAVPPASSACRPVARALRKKIDAALRPLYQPHLKPSKIYVEIGCDPLATPVREIVVEHGSGVDGTLSVWKITREDSRWDVTGVSIYARARGCDARYLGRDACFVRVAHGQLPAGDVDAVLPLVRASLLAKVEDRPTARGGPVASVLSMSSAAVHRLVRVSDDSGQDLERAFTGYEDNGPGQVDRLTAEQAARPLVALLGRIPFSRRPPTDAERALFAERLRAALARKPAPWVTECLVKMAPVLGTAAVVPALLRVAAAPADDRTGFAAVNALALITGWDARFSTDGRPRPLAQVERDYQEQCRALNVAGAP